MMGFKNFIAAQKTLVGIELMAMIKKGQIKTLAGDHQSPAGFFYLANTMSLQSTKKPPEFKTVVD